MRLHLIIVTLLSAAGSPAADLQPGLASGQAYYRQGDFKRAANHFQRALRADPDDPELNYWLGMAYQGRSDLAAPFAAGYQSRALVYLTRAVELAPDRPRYRRELFDFLLDSGRTSPAALRRAATVLERTSASDPEFTYMRWRLDREKKMSSTADVAFDRALLSVPRAAFRAAQR
jgi:tetratricopeptide (TPR) repeat protein